jgi:hypothetical protein
MPILLPCSCGKQLRIPDDFAGKRIKCPACSEILTVPDAALTPARTGVVAHSVPAPVGGMLRFSCTCGKVMQAKSEFAGRSTRCPACQSTLTIPGAGEIDPRISTGLPGGGGPTLPDEWDTAAPIRRSQRRGRKQSPWLWIGLAAGFLLLIGGAIGAYFLFFGGKISSDMALVPGDAQAFVTVRVGDVWNLDVTQSIVKQAPEGRELAHKAEMEFGIGPADVERMTLVMMDLQKQPSFAIVAAKKALDRQKLLAKAGDAGGKEIEYKGKKYHSAKKETALYFVDAKTLVIGEEEAVKQFIDHQKSPKSPDGGLKDALKLASGKTHVVAWAKVPAGQLKQAGGQLPPQAAQFQALLDLKEGMVALDLGNTLVLDVTLGFENSTKADAAKKGIDEAVKMAKAFMPLLKMQGMGAGAQAQQAQQAFEKLEKALNSVGVDQRGSSVHVGMKAELDPAILAGLTLPAVQKVREASNRVAGSNNLKQIGLALHLYHDAHGHFPPAVIYSKDGKKPLYSWRVELLPYLEQQALYDEFKKDEPWDSEHNKKLIPRMPAVFATPSQAQRPGFTNYRLFTGPQTPFDGKKTTKMAEVKDGLSNTLGVVESVFAVEWTRPEELKFPLQAMPGFLGTNPGAPTFNALTLDGAVHAFKKSMSPEDLRKLITHQGGEIIDFTKMEGGR